MRAPRSLVSRRHLFRPAPRREPDGRTDAADLLRARRDGMGSYFEVRLPAAAPGALPLANRALDLIGGLEAQLSVYRDDSEISRLNESAHLGPVAVEPGLFGLLETARTLHGLTDGAYDVTAGALSAAWGFTRGPRRVPDPASLDEARARTGQALVSLDPGRRTVAFHRPGVVLNLGSIGKGYALDRAAELIGEHWWPTPALLHGGRSSVYALGSPAGTLGGSWDVALPNPLDPTSPLGTFRLRNRGLGTSGATYQRFEAGGRVYGHILDPRTGRPADGPLGVTVVAPTAAQADALSTAFYLLGPEAVATRIHRYPDVGAVFVLPGSRSDGPPIVRICGLDRSEFTPAAGVVVRPLHPARG